MTVIANAKLNLYLDIIGTREDGYHLLETVMQSITLSDVLDIDISDGDGTELVCDRADIPSDERNIAYKAARAYLDAAKIKARVRISIAKRIPSGAGMGGGSADAAAVLAALDRHFGALGKEKLYETALSCGADVPFCLAGGTKLCKGIGEEISPVAAVKGYAFLVVMPDFTCPTGEAYRKYDAAPVAARGELREFCESISCGSFSGRMYNVFEALYADERIEDIKARLAEVGADGAMLTGSGAAVFGVFKDEKAAAQAAKSFPMYFTSVCSPTENGILFA